MNPPNPPKGGDEPQTSNPDAGLETPLSDADAVELNPFLRDALREPGWNEVVNAELARQFEYQVALLSRKLGEAQGENDEAIETINVMRNSVVEACVRLPNVAEYIATLEQKLKESERIAGEIKMQCAIGYNSLSTEPTWANQKFDAITKLCEQLSKL